VSFKSRLKVRSGGADDTECGRVFQARRAATVNARSPSVEQRVMVGMISCDVAADRRCRRVVTSDTHWKLLVRYSGAVPCRHAQLVLNPLRDTQPV